MSAPRALSSSGVPFVPGTRIMSPKQVKIDAVALGNREAVVDAPRRQHADRAAGAVNELDVFGQDVAQAVTVDRMGVAAADFHDAVMPRWDRRFALSRAQRRR